MTDRRRLRLQLTFAAYAELRLPVAAAFTHPLLPAQLGERSEAKLLGFAVMLAPVRAPLTR